MTQFNRSWQFLALAAGLGWCLSVGPVWAADSDAPTQASRDPARILADLDVVVLPKFDRTRSDDPASREEQSRRMNEFLERRAALIGELWQVDSTSAVARRLIVERWRALGQLHRGKEALPEIKNYFSIAGERSANEDAAFFAAIVEIDQGSNTDADRLAAVDRYRGRSADQSRLLPLITFAVNEIKDDRKRLPLLEEIVAKKPGTREAASAEGRIRRIKKTGHPFELDFTDAITGRPVSIEGLRGKVVIVEFWATWCAPCRAFLPKLRALHEAHHKDGLEIVSVSLDAPGDASLAKVRDVAAEEGMAWHHYYPGNGFESAFTMAWGIDSIPAVFVIDREGRLAHTEARRELDALIPALLSARHVGAATSNPTTEPALNLER